MEQDQIDQTQLDRKHPDPLEEAQELIADYLATYGDAACRDPDHGTCHELVLALENLLSKITAKEETDHVAVNRMISRAYDEGYERGLIAAQMKQDSRIDELIAFQELITDKVLQLQNRVKDIEQRRVSLTDYSRSNSLQCELEGAMIMIRLIMKKHNIPVVSVERNEVRDMMTNEACYLLRSDDPVTGAITLKLGNK